MWISYAVFWLNLAKQRSQNAAYNSDSGAESAGNRHSFGKLCLNSNMSEPVAWLRRISRIGVPLVPLTLMFVFALACPCRAQTNQTSVLETNQSRLISLRECIDLALARSLGVQIARLSPELARYELKASYGVYDPMFSLEASRTYTDQPENFDPKKLNSQRAALDLEYEETVDKVGPSFSGRLPFGMHYEAFARAEPESAFTVSSGIRTNNYYSVVGIGFTQPLLKNFLIDADRRNLRIARHNLKISEWQLRSQLINAVTQVKLSYYNLILAREEIIVDRVLLDRAERLASDVHKRVEARGLSPLEEPRVQSQVELARTALFAAEQAYTTQVNALWNRISDDYTNQSNITLTPADALVFVDATEPRPTLHQTALASSPELWEMKLNLEKQDVVIAYDKNQRLPDLSLRAGYGRHSVQPDFDTTLDDLARGPHDFYTFGAALTFPIGNITARNRLKADQTARQQLVLSYRKLQQDTLFAVDSAANSLESAARQIGSSRKAREYAEVALDAESRLFEAGRSTTFLVLEAQSALAQARLVELRALAQFNVAKAELERATGVTLERTGVNLNIQP
jgi:outer membrane protein TolC